MEVLSGEKFSQKSFADLFSATGREYMSDLAMRLKNDAKWLGDAEQSTTSLENEAAEILSFLSTMEFGI